MVSAELCREGRPFYIHVSLSPASAPHPSPNFSKRLQGGLAGRRGIAAVPKIAPQAAGGPRELARAAKKVQKGAKAATPEMGGVTIGVCDNSKSNIRSCRSTKCSFSDFSAGSSCPWLWLCERNRERQSAVDSFAGSACGLERLNP